MGEHWRHDGAASRRVGGGDRARGPTLGEWAHAAADGLTAGEGEEVIVQALVQDFLWYRLPAKYPERAWLPLARAVTSLLRELGLERYASIAASDMTTTILDAWREDPARGFARYRSAAEASGVKPPDTDLLAWGSVMGFDEASAYAQLELKLEEAIGAGRFTPGSSGWKSRAASVTDEALLEPPAHDGRRSWLEMILSERRRTWVEMAHPEGLRQWRASRADEFTSPTDPPDDLEPVVGAMRWLLETCRDGVEFTQSGYLSPSIVREGVELFGWWDWPGQPRSEVDVHQLGALRETAARLRLVTRRGRRLGTSRRGVALLEHPASLWRAVATTIGANDDYMAMLSELIAHRLLAGPALGNELEASIVPVITEQGWRSGGDAVDERHIVMSIHRPLYFWRLFGLLEEVRPRWVDNMPTGPNVTSLTAAGRPTALEYLRARASAPRRSLHT